MLLQFATQDGRMERGSGLGLTGQIGLGPPPCHLAGDRHR